MLRFEVLLDISSDESVNETPQLMYRDIIYLELRNNQYREYFRHSKLQVQFISNKIGSYIAYKTNEIRQSQ